MDKLQVALETNEFLILDGAMGTLLFAMGLEQGAPPELWNVAYPERLQEVHGRYIDAGSQVILTNSFGGTSYRLKLHNLQDQVYELNRAASENGRAAANNAPHPVLVGGSMGPTGELLEPMGTMTFEEAKAAFAEQAKGLVEGGVDLLWIETMSHLDEVQAAVEGVRQVTDLSIAATMSFDTNGRTMMGVTAAQAMQTMREWNLAAIGANCGNNLPDTMAAVAAMHAVDSTIPLIAKANAGIPEWGGDGQLVYDGTPEVMAGYAYHVQQMGARLIGACCGSSPDTIWAMRAALDGEFPPNQLLLPQRKDATDAAPNPMLPTDNKRPRRRRRRRGK
ncbi:MAG: betaine--homocysteine S-methyltransferase [Chloroflexi bacterium]|nr:betaine--homocysteine S-methyltransferase [Chloroflexota bacterium]